MEANKYRFETFFGNTKWLRFNLRRYLQKPAWDVSAAGQIVLEIEDPQGVDRNPIMADSGAPGADWAAGVVMIEIGPGDVCGTIGTWSTALTLFIGGEEVTVASGPIECYDRPGFSAP